MLYSDYTEWEAGKRTLSGDGRYWIEIYYDYTEEVKNEPDNDSKE